MAEYLDEVSTIITVLDTVNEIIPEKRSRHVRHSGAPISLLLH